MIYDFYPLTSQIHTLMAAETELENYNLNGQVSNFYNLVTYLFMFILVIGVLIVVLRFLKRYSANLGKSTHMRLLDSLPIDNEKKLLLVEVGDKVLLLGAGKEINLLTSIKLNPEELRLIRETGQAPGDAVTRIWQKLKDKVPVPFSSKEDDFNNDTESFEQQLQEELEKIRRSKNEGGSDDEER